MKLFVAVVMFIVVPVVFAQDFVWRVTSSPQEGSTRPNNQTQDGRQNSGDILGVQIPTSKPDTGYKSTESNKGGENKPPWVAISSLFVSIFSAAFALYSLRLTDEIRKITERAYLAAEQWAIEGNVIVCNVANRGRTPATLLYGYTEFTLWAGPSADVAEFERPVGRNFGETDLPAQGAFPMEVGILKQEQLRAVKEERTLILRVVAHIRYRDAFKNVWPMRFAMEYDGRIDKFIIADKRSSTKKWKEHQE